MTLQLGVAYQDGWGTLTKNTQLASKYFTSLISDNTDLRSTLWAKGYAYIMGLGVTKDIDRGLKLIEDADKNKLDNIS